MLIATVAIGGLILCGFGIWQFGSIAYARAYFQGFSVIPESQAIDLGQVEMGTRVTAAIRLKNLTGKPVRVTGAESKCGCVAYEDLPIEIKPASSATIRAWFNTPKNIVGNQSSNNADSSDAVKHEIRLLLDVESPPVVVALLATAISPPGPTLADESSTN